eukprot:631652-Pelagomonas_calceolata.AAC.2
MRCRRTDGMGVRFVWRVLCTAEPAPGAVTWGAGALAGCSCCCSAGFSQELKSGLILPPPSTGLGSREGAATQATAVLPSHLGLPASTARGARRLPTSGAEGADRLMASRGHGVGRLWWAGVVCARTAPAIGVGSVVRAKEPVNSPCSGEIELGELGRVAGPGTACT